MKRTILWMLLVCLSSQMIQAQSGQWVWMKGSSAPNAVGNFGIKGVSSPSNEPPARYQAAYWIDLQGNYWMFGGSEAMGAGHNDLWKYDPSSNQWTWVSGEMTGVNPSGNYGTMGIPSTLNYPPALGYGSNCWTDKNGDLWLFGGFDQSTFGMTDDLWKYHIPTNEWTWVQGSGSFVVTSATYGPKGVYGNAFLPGSRAECKSGWLLGDELWLYGGQDATSSSYGDLWSYDINTNQWAWQGGTQALAFPGSYGIKGVASPSNIPPSRCSYTKWKDANNNLYLFAGGQFFTTLQLGRNDVWKFDMGSKEWVWISGSNIGDNLGFNPPFCEPDTTKYPVSRIENQTAQTNSSCINAFWTFGGFDFSGLSFHNDLWLFNTENLEWTKVSGEASLAGVPAPYSFGSQGVASPTNMPPGRGGPSVWTDNSGNFWICGGGGNINSTWGYLNDLWKFIPDTSCFKTGLTGITLAPPAQTTLCPGDTIQYNVPGNVQINLQPSTGANYNTASGQISFFGPGTNTYTLTANSLNPNDPCFLNDTLVFTISGYSIPKADFIVSPLIAGITNPNFDLVNTSINAQNYEWYLDDVLISTNKDLNWTINQVGKFCFKLIAFGDCNQKDSITKCVEVVDQGVISFPNVFSPNGDNLNDVFRPIIKGDYTITNFQIFNRWGQSVYQFRNYSTKPEWDGTYQGERCEMGTYFYMAEVSDGMGVHQMIKGDVILLR